MYLVKLLLQTLILPPTSLVLLAIGGVVLWPRRIGRILVGSSLVLYFVLGLPATGHVLLAALPRSPVLSPVDLGKAQAIVLLSGGINPNAPEYGGQDAIGAPTLFRARYAAWLHRRTGLPILVVGERIIPSRETEADVTARVLRDEFGIPVHWVVGEGRDTIESATASAGILLPAGIEEIALVTSATHMTRASIAFRKAGFTVLPAPTGGWTERELGLRDFLPSAAGMSRSSHAIREWLGRIWTLVFG